MAAFSETYYYQKYRDSFSISRNTEELVELFKSATTMFSNSLLTDLNILTHQELREFKEDVSRVRLSERRETQARNLIEKVRRKDCLTAYRGFRIFAKREAHKSGQMVVLNRIFPFGDKEDCDGLAPAIVSNGRVYMSFSNVSGIIFTPFSCTTSYGASSKHKTNCFVDDINSSRI